MTIAIVGGGVAGFSAAQELRARGYDGELVIVSPEGLPYDRPPLSKGYLLGTEDGEKILLAPEFWYAEHDVEVVASRADALDLTGERPALTLDGGHRLAAYRILLTTGGTPRRLAIPGGEQTHVLRSRADSDALRRVLVPGARITVVGAGLIGAEVASAAAARGAEATLIDPVATPLVPALGEALAGRLHAMHAEHGVRTVVGVPAEIRANGAAPGPACLVRLADGSAVAADVVLTAIGIRPDTALAGAAGLDLDDGILVGPDGATSHPAVFAAGDATRTRRVGGVVREPVRRAEHWEAAVRSGQTAAAGMLGEEPEEFGAPWFWSDRYGVHAEAVGSLDPRSAPGSRMVLREAAGVPEASFLIAADGHLLGCAAVDQPLVIRAARRIIDRGMVPDPERLADPSVDPRKLAR
ncbi:FAD-dependent oxidoreductase [Sinomonas notoginsengisoli]|uniref:NAD(P)/FAD-dependent oxidoreductase n=1 Tax=Sinomonas notoginsengisoli TaxID=1457311 RepID=UPI001F463FF3|nr:FAD-dependent oxidoreductase [Sinomonas notoginsengisoli]